MAAEASAGVFAAAAERGADEGDAASSRRAVVADEADEREGGAPVHPGGAERMGFPATPRGMMRRDGGGGEGRAGAGAGGAAAEVEGEEEEVDGGDEEAAAAAPLLFLAETAKAAFLFGLRRTGGCVFVFFVFLFSVWRGARG